MKPLFVGVGCRRGSSADDIENAVRHALGTFAFEDIGAIASIDSKRSESGLREFCERHRFPLRFFSASEIALKPGAYSEHARKHMNVDGVCEPCALLASGTKGHLAVFKTIVGGVTIAIAINQA
jgi:cobalt-precorrin 5A hydrolase